MARTTLTDAQSSEITRRYKLPIEELTDETKFRKRVISTKTIANLSIAAAQGSPVPGLPVLIFVANAVRTKMRLLNGSLALLLQMFESFNRVQVCRYGNETLLEFAYPVLTFLTERDARISNDN